VLLWQDIVACPQRYTASGL